MAFPVFVCADGEQIKIVERNRFSKRARFGSSRYFAIKWWRDHLIRSGINACLFEKRGMWAVYRNGMEWEYEGHTEKDAA
jgi:hypothetical protein